MAVWAAGLKAFGIGMMMQAGTLRIGVSESRVVDARGGSRIARHGDEQEW